jgi:ATP-dependent Clp protease adaptor protein ClpS
MVTGASGADRTFQASPWRTLNRKALRRSFPMSQTPENRGQQPSGEAGTGMTSVAAPELAPVRMDRLPPWRVLLHNDDINTPKEVAESIVELTPLNMQRAIECMLEAHTTGVSMLLVTHRERAELFQDQFISKRLTVTIEPAE